MDKRSRDAMELRLREHEETCGRPYRFHLYERRVGQAYAHPDAFAESYAGMMEHGQAMADSRKATIVAFPCLRCSALIGDRTFTPSKGAQ